MCKVTIKKVVKIHPVRSGTSDGREWKLHIFECRIRVDGDEREVLRTVKTFDQALALRIAQLDDGSKDVFESTKQPVGSTYEYLVKPEKKGYRNKRGGNDQPFGPTNRQQALRVAVELWRARSAEQGVPEDEQIVETAETFLNWLEGGAQ